MLYFDDESHNIAHIFVYGRAKQREIGDRKQIILLF